MPQRSLRTAYFRRCLTVATTLPFRKRRYPLTRTLSFEARHETEIVVWVATFAAKALGLLGRSRSAALACPVPMAAQTPNAATIPRYRPMGSFSRRVLDRQLP